MMFCHSKGHHPLLKERSESCPCSHHPHINNSLDSTSAHTSSLYFSLDFISIQSQHEGLSSFHVSPQLLHATSQYFKEKFCHISSFQSHVLCFCVCSRVCICTHTYVHVAETILQESVLSFHHVFLRLNSVRLAAGAFVLSLTLALLFLLFSGDFSFLWHTVQVPSLAMKPF